MIYFNNQPETESPARLRLTQRNLALALDENNRLRAENEELQQAIDSRGAGMWALVESNNRVIDIQYRRIKELCADLEDARAELLSGQRIAELTAENEELRKKKANAEFQHDAIYGLWQWENDKNEELKADLEDARAENVRLTGQIHAQIELHQKQLEWRNRRMDDLETQVQALLATIEQAAQP